LQHLFDLILFHCTCADSLRREMLADDGRMALDNGNACEVVRHPTDSRFIFSWWYPDVTASLGQLAEMLDFPSYFRFYVPHSL